MKPEPKKFGFFVFRHNGRLFIEKLNTSERSSTPHKAFVDRRRVMPINKRRELSCWLLPMKSAVRQEALALEGVTAESAKVITEEQRPQQDGSKKQPKTRYCQLF